MGSDPKSLSPVPGPCGLAPPSSSHLVLSSPSPTTSSHADLVLFLAHAQVIPPLRSLPWLFPCQEHPPPCFTWLAPPSHTGLLQTPSGATQQFVLPTFLLTQLGFCSRAIAVPPPPLGVHLDLSHPIMVKQDRDRGLFCGHGLLAKDSS